MGYYFSTGGEGGLTLISQPLILNLTLKPNPKPNREIYVIYPSEGPDSSAPKLMTWGPGHEN